MLTGIPRHMKSELICQHFLWPLLKTSYSYYGLRTGKLSYCRLGQKWYRLRRLAEVVSVSPNGAEDRISSGARLSRSATWAPPIRRGEYNILYQLRIEGQTDVTVRLPQLHMIWFPEKKGLREGAIASFISQNTGVPVPRVLSYGSTSLESGVGPFIIVQYVENWDSTSETLAIVNERNPDDAHMLDPNSSDSELRTSYKENGVPLTPAFRTQVFPYWVPSPGWWHHLFSYRTTDNSKYEQHTPTCEYSSCRPSSYKVILINYTGFDT